MYFLKSNIFLTIDNLYEMDQFLETYNPPRLKVEEITIPTDLNE